MERDQIPEFLSAAQRAAALELLRNLVTLRPVSVRDVSPEERMRRAPGIDQPPMHTGSISSALEEVIATLRDRDQL